MSKIKVLGIAGSPREDSYNRKHLALAAKMLSEMGVENEVFDVREHKVPIYDPDVESTTGMPAVIKLLRDKISVSDAVLLSCPEYNAGPTPLMKSVIDWGSRKDRETGIENVWKGKVAALIAASPGGFGGARGLITLRQSLAHVEVLLIPQFTVVPAAHEAFAEDGTLKNERSAKTLGVVLENLVAVATKMKAD